MPRFGQKRRDRTYRVLGSSGPEKVREPVRPIVGADVSAMFGSILRLQCSRQGWSVPPEGEYYESSLLRLNVRPGFDERSDPKRIYLKVICWGTVLRHANGEDLGGLEGILGPSSDRKEARRISRGCVLQMMKQKTNQ